LDLLPPESESLRRRFGEGKIHQDFPSAQLFEQPSLVIRHQHAFAFGDDVISLGPQALGRPLLSASFSR
jgi:hypothetical protein